MEYLPSWLFPTFFWKYTGCLQVSEHEFILVNRIKIHKFPITKFKLVWIYILGTPGKLKGRCNIFCPVKQGRHKPWPVWSTSGNLEKVIQLWQVSQDRWGWNGCTRRVATFPQQRGIENEDLSNRSNFLHGNSNFGAKAFLTLGL